MVTAQVTTEDTEEQVDINKEKDVFLSFLYHYVPSGTWYHTVHTSVHSLSETITFNQN